MDESIDVAAAAAADDDDDYGDGDSSNTVTTKRKPRKLASVSKKRKQETIEEGLLMDVAKKIKERHSEPKTKDSIDFFVMSLASDIKKLPERLQCMVKNEIGQVVFKYQMMMWNNPNQNLPYGRPNLNFPNFQTNIPFQMQTNSSINENQPMMNAAPLPTPSQNTESFNLYSPQF